ncbi:hypothetical protein EG328_007015 [Venturia inaequalis]|uniref:Uncharacterized protein n=1 Tax=Venturia inaequalis TaxID=5025 RepID=A0A8H3U0S8_VENIN|nr:hypothetical protein EG328_007015 [Venturia inaequalis]
MALPKTLESKSTNTHTVKELGRRTKLSGFGLILDKSKRALKQAESNARVKLRKSAGFTSLSKVEQDTQFAEAIAAINTKRIANGTHPSQVAKKAPKNKVENWDDPSNNKGQEEGEEEELEKIEIDFPNSNIDEEEEMFQ